MEDFKIIFIKKGVDIYFYISNNIEKVKYDIEEFLKYDNIFLNIEDNNGLAKTEYLIKDIIDISEISNPKEELHKVDWINQIDYFSILSFINHNKEEFVDADNEDVEFKMLYLKINNNNTLIKIKKILQNQQEVKSGNPYSYIESINNEKYFNYISEIVFITDNVFSEQDIGLIKSGAKPLFLVLSSFGKVVSSTVNWEENSIILHKNKFDILFQIIDKKS
jgi:hypothetical protein